MAIGSAMGVLFESMLYFGIMGLTVPYLWSLKTILARWIEQAIKTRQERTAFLAQKRSEAAPFKLIS